MNRYLLLIFFVFISLSAFGLFSYFFPTSDTDSLVIQETEGAVDTQLESKLLVSEEAQDNTGLDASEEIQDISKQQNETQNPIPEISEKIEVTSATDNNLNNELINKPNKETATSEISLNKRETLNPESFNKSLVIYSFIFSSVVILMLLITTILLFKEVKWRKRHSKHESLVFPDAHLDVLEDLKLSFGALTEAIVEFGKSSNNLQLKNENLYQQMLESMSTFTNLIDDQKKEISRLKEGYDFSIKRNSIRSLIDLKVLIVDIYKQELSDETLDTLRKVNNYISADLEELDIEELTFNQGMSVRSLPSDDYEVTEVCPTDDLNLNETVVETVSSGYVHNHENGRNVIRKAKIKVHKTEGLE